MTSSPVVRPALRARELWRHRAAASGKPDVALRYLLNGKEVTNFTYPLENLDELAGFVARICQAPIDGVRALLAEVENDEVLIEHLRRKLSTRADRQDEPYFGRRLIWYCLIRLERPKIIVETGTHDGLGTALMISALRRNAAEGSPAQLHSFDIDPAAGWLARDIGQDTTTFHLGDIRRTLPATLAGTKIDMFIHDSLHTYEQEEFEYGFAVENAASRLILVSDNARTGAADDFEESTYALRDLCASLGAQYAVFRERPAGHFVGGGSAGVGLISRPGT